jgi:hypothetical protein
MKKITILMAAAMIFVGTATFANTTVKAHKAAKTTEQAEKPAMEKKAHKGHKKHHHKKAAGAPAKAAPATK